MKPKTHHAPNGKRRAVMLHKVLPMPAPDDDAVQRLREQVAAQLVRMVRRVGDFSTAAARSGR